MLVYQRKKQKLWRSVASSLSLFRRFEHVWVKPNYYCSSIQPLTDFNQQCSWAYEGAA